MNRYILTKILVVLMTLLLAVGVFAACNKEETVKLPSLEITSAEEFKDLTGFDVPENIEPTGEVITLTQELAKFSASDEVLVKLNVTPKQEKNYKVYYDFYSNFVASKGANYKVYYDEAMTKLVTISKEDDDGEIEAVDVEITENNYEFWMRVYMKGDASIYQPYHLIFTRKALDLEYVTNCPTAVEKDTIHMYSIIEFPEIEYENHALVGWYKDEACTIEYENGSVHTSSFAGLKLYAKWVTAQENGDFAYTTSGDRATLVGLSEKGKQKTSLTIPQSINGINVVGIGSYAFFGESSLQELIIDRTGLSLGKNAFDGVADDFVITFSGEGVGASYVANASWRNLAELFASSTIATSGDFSYIALDDANAILTGTTATAPIIPKTINELNVLAIAGSFASSVGLTSVTLHDDWLSGGVLPIVDGALDGDYPIYAVDSYKTADNWSVYSARIVDKATYAAGKCVSAEVADENFKLSLAVIEVADGESEGTYVADAMLTGITRVGGELTEIDINAMLTAYNEAATTKYTLVGVAANALKNNTLLTKITLPTTATAIGASAFEGCTALKSVSGATFSSLGENAFYGASELAGTIRFSGKIVGDYAFYGTAITDFVANNATYIGKHAFENSELPKFTADKLIVVDDYAFSASKLTGVTFGNSLTRIGDYAFYDCNALEVVQLGNSVADIGEYAFRGTAIVSLTLPSSVNCIGAHAFESISSLTSVAIGVDSRLTSIGDSAFYNCKSAGAFPIMDCVALYEIGDNALYNFGVNSSSVLRHRLLISNTLEHIGDYAFSGGEKFNALATYGSGESRLTSIGAYAFRGTAISGTVTITSAVETIGNYAFAGLGNLETLVFSEDSSLTTIGNNAFSSTRIGGDLVLPASVTSLGSGAFNGTKLVTATINAALTEIKNYTFNNCVMLSSVVFETGSNLTTIGGNAFKGCTKLNGFTIPAKVTTIGTSAFMNCKELVTLYTLAEVPPTLGLNCFLKTGLLNVTYVAEKKVYVKSGFNSLGAPYIESYRCPTKENTPGYVTEMDNWMYLSEYLEVFAS